MKENLYLLTYDNNFNIICAARDMETIQKVKNMECYYNSRSEYMFNVKEIPLYDNIDKAIEAYSSNDKVYFDVLFSIKNGEYDFVIETTLNVKDFGSWKVKNRIEFYIKNDNLELINVRGYINRIVNEYDDCESLYNRIKHFIIEEYKRIKAKYPDNDLLYAFEHQGAIKDGTLYLAIYPDKKDSWVNLSVLNEM